MKKLMKQAALLAAAAAATGTSTSLNAQEDYTPVYIHYYVDANGEAVGSYRDTCNRGYIGATASEGMVTSQEQLEIYATCDTRSGDLHPY